MSGKFGLRKAWGLLVGMLVAVFKLLVNWKWTPKMIVWPVAAYVVLEYTVPYWGASNWYEVVFYHMGALPLIAMCFDLWEELHQTVPSWAKPAGLRPVVVQKPKLHAVLMKRAWLPKLVIIPLASFKAFEWLVLSGGLMTWIGLALVLAIIVEIMVEAFQQEAANAR